MVEMLCLFVGLIVLFAIAVDVSEIVKLLREILAEIRSDE